MPELKLGTKYECFSCGTKFYDLGKSEPVCPKCGANQKDAAQSESPAASQSSRKRRKVDVAKGLDVDDAEPIAADDLDEEAAAVPEGLEDVDLGDDDEEEEDDFDDEE